MGASPEKPSSRAVSASDRPVGDGYDPDGSWLRNQRDGRVRRMTYRNVVALVIRALLAAPLA